MKLQVAVIVFGLRVEDRLEGTANFSPWKARISLILEENELWDIVHSTTTNPVIVPADATDKATFMKRNVGAHQGIPTNVCRTIHPSRKTFHV